MKNSSYYLFVFCLIFFIACNNTSSNEDNSESETSQLTPTPDIVETEDQTKKTTKKGDATIEAVGNYSSKGSLKELDTGKCDYIHDKDPSCSCLFTTGDRYKGPAIFYSNFNEFGCLNINGEVNIVYDSNIDFKKKLAELSTADNWISLNDDNTLFFGKPLSEYGYDDEIIFLTDVILASGRNITEIPIENNATGMAIRELRDRATDAITKANEMKAKQFEDAMFYMAFDNRTYDVIIRTRRMTNYEGEANHYDGQIILMSNDGKTVLDKKDIKGTCGC